MSTEEALGKVEKELKSLKDELSLCKEAKSNGEACKGIVEYCETTVEPFSPPNVGDEPNKWHKNPSKGGGCCTIV